MLYADGRQPSEFTNSDFCGIDDDCGDSISPVNPNPTNPTDPNNNKVINTFWDLFTKSSSIEEFFELLFANIWVIFVWF